MGLVTLAQYGSDPVTVNAANLDAKVNPLATEFNGNIENVNIKASAGITYSKLNLTGSILNADVSASAAIDASKIDLSSVGQTIAMSSKAINMAKGSDIASATTTDIGAATGNYIDVTGTTTITGLGTVQAGTFRMVRFTGALTLTHNGTSLLLPTAANITTAANDVAGFVSLGSGNWKCLWYQRYDGTSLASGTVSTALSGSVIQTVNTIVTSASSGTTVFPSDDTIPQNTEGDEYMTLSITPNNASNLLKITVVAVLAESTGPAEYHGMGLFQDSNANALAAVPFANGPQIFGAPVTLVHYMTAGTTSATTFKVRAGSDNGATIYFNSLSGGRIYGGKSASSITIQEIKA